MAVMDALLRIKAAVTGGEAIQQLGQSLGQLNRTASQVGGGLSKLAGSAGNVISAFSPLAGLATAGGLFALTKSAINAADNMNDLSQSTGVSVENLSRLKQAADASGTTIETVGRGLNRLSKAMAGSTESAADAAEAALEKQLDAVKTNAEKEIEVIREKESRQLDQIKTASDRQIDTVRDNQDKQIDAVKEAADRKIEVVQDESERILSEINRRYRDERRLLNDKYNDEQDVAQEAADESQRAEERRIQRRFDTIRDEIQEADNLSKQEKRKRLEAVTDREQSELEIIRDFYKQAQKERDRSFRDRQQQEEDALESRQKSEQDQVKRAEESKRKIIEDQAKLQTETIKKAAEASITEITAQTKAASELVKKQSDADVKIVEANMKRTTDALKDGSAAAAAAIKGLGVEIKTASGELRNPADVFYDIANAFQKMPDGAQKTATALALFGKSGAEMIPLLNGGGDAIKRLLPLMTTDFARAADSFNDKQQELVNRMQGLSLRIAEVLLPPLEKIVDIFLKMPPAVQQTIVILAGLLAALTLLAPAITGIINLFTVLAGLRIGATIAGWLPIALPFFTGITTALTGLLAFMTSTFLPGMIAVFTGPVGWTILAAAAVTAMVIAFHKPIGEFLAWLGQNLQTGLKVALDIAYKVFVQPWATLFNLTLRQPISNLFSWMVGAVRAPLQAIGNFVRDVFNGILNAIASGINAAVGAINTLIRAYNSLPTPDLPLVPAVSVPRFAEGGVVDRPTLAMVGEGGEREYIIPESKMAAASARYLSGARGGGVIGPSSINITTGPVMQQDGQRWVSLSDLERAMRQTEASTLARIRTPAGRRALGVR